MLSTLAKYINNNFGSKRGLVASLKYRLLFLAGFYKAYQHVDFKTVKCLVFVCSGNICRSSFGEHLARAKGLNATSYGLHCRGGDKADPRAIHEASIRGVDMGRHVTRNISEYEPQKGELILVMEPRHLVELALKDVKYDQVTIVPLWAEKPTPYLHDPINSSDTFFSQCESVVEQCIGKVQARLSAEENGEQSDVIVTNRKSSR
ncbi:hypothetical protein N9164_07105 [Draconibacterium sp.]|nr:hypothetical protein [Draconibacterium sp.]